MRPRSLREVCAATSGNLWITGEIPTDGTTIVTGVAIDSRRVRPGDLFFALEGEHTHGIEFAPEAVRRGAVAVVVTESHRRRAPGAAVIVDDSVRALQRLASRARSEDRRRTRAAVITGSVGKTTVCRFVRQLLRGSGVTHSPPGSFNNHLGVPLTILGAPHPCDHLLCEIGSNAPGEVLPLAESCHPEVAAVTAVAPAHLLGFGTIEAVAREKLSILRVGREAWVPVTIARRYPAEVAHASGRLSTFAAGSGECADLAVEPVSAGAFVLRLPRERRALPFRWEAPTRHAISNLEIALGIAHGMGVDWETLLERVPDLTLPPLRGEVRRHAGVDLVLDCYNSSPVALESAVTHLEEVQVHGRRVCVVGTMEELGEEEMRWHQRLGTRLANLDTVYALGRARDWYHVGLQQAGSEAQLIANDDGSAERVAAALRPGDRVLFKASRAERLESFAERVADALDGRGAGRP